MDRKNLKSSSNTKWITSFFIRLTSLIKRVRVARFSFRAELELEKRNLINLESSIEHRISSQVQAWHCIGSAWPNYTSSYNHHNYHHTQGQFQNNDRMCKRVNNEACMLFIEVRKLKDREWYRSSSFFKSPNGFSIVTCRSLNIKGQKHAQVIILRETLLRIREFDITHIICMDDKKKWRKFFDPSTTVNWNIYLVFSNIIFLFSHLQVEFLNYWHLIIKEVRKFATKAISIQVFNSWP